MVRGRYFMKVPKVSKKEHQYSTYAFDAKMFSLINKLYNGSYCYIETSRVNIYKERLSLGSYNLLVYN